MRQWERARPRQWRAASIVAASEMEREFPSNDATRENENQAEERRQFRMGSRRRRLSVRSPPDLHRTYLSTTYVQERVRGPGLIAIPPRSTRGPTASARRASQLD